MPEEELRKKREQLMFDALYRRFSKGLLNLKDNRQLLYTIVVAIVIFASFFFVVDRFAGIAQDAQERLINVRVGSIHDAFVVFAEDELDNPALLQSKMERIAGVNETIERFRVIQFINGRPVILASLRDEEVGGEIMENDLLFELAKTNTDSSFTTEEWDAGERFFRTVRAISGKDGTVVAVTETRQTLSEADKQIERAIEGSLFAFIIIVIVLILLFFRYARVIDYAMLYRRLKEIDQLKDDFIAMASHELRSPLATIRGYIELIKDSAKLNEEESEYARRVDVSAKQLDELVADMLDVSRIEQGRMRFTYTDFNIEEVIADIIESFRRIAEKKGLKLKKEGLKEIIAHLDREKVRRVLVNLVSNAIKYTKHGEVSLSYKSIGNMVEIRVSDTGIGMNRDDQEKLFQKFYRVRSAETEEIQGTGLGLWLSREIIRKLKGDITVESIEGVGTHFIVLLPVLKKSE